MAYFQINVGTNAGGAADVFGAAISGVQRFDRVVLPSGRVVNLWSRIADTWRHRQRERWRTAGASEGVPWNNYTQPELAYAAIKREIFGRSLTRGDLNRWIRGRERLFPAAVSRFHPEHRQVETARRLHMVLAVPYAADLHHGRGRAPAHLGGGRRPRRPLVNISNALRRDVRADMVAFAAELEAAIGTQINREQVVRTRGGRTGV